MAAMDSVDPVLIKAVAIGGLGTAACFGWIYRLVIMTSIADALGYDIGGKEDDSKKSQ